MKKTAASILAASALIVGSGAQEQERIITDKISVKANVNDVWTAWTTSGGIKTFFAPDANVEARVGGPFQIYMNPFAPPGMKGADDMRFLAVQDKKMISFTWNAPPHLPEARAQRTHVTVRFKPSGNDETEVTIHHDGWGDGGQWDQAYAYFDKAWGSVLANLQKRFVEKKPIDWSPFLERLKAAAEKK